MANTEFYFQEKKLDGILFTIDSDGKLSKHFITGNTSIGRNSSQSNPNIALKSSIVSRRHGEINNISGKYYYMDCDSKNGTYVNSQLLGRVSPNNQYAIELNDGDILNFDVVKNGVHHNERIIAIFTTSLSNDVKWKRIKLNTEIAEIRIGRSNDSGLIFNNTMISENHASFFQSTKGWTIIDHGSKNGVFCNAKKITAPQYLNNGDVIRIANVFFIFFKDYILFSEDATHNNLDGETTNNPQKAFDTSKKLNISITERSVIQRFKKIALLQDINLTISSGEMVLILGGSGAGKTTFINAVMGYEKARGKITYDNTDIYDEYEQMKYEIGFVPQQDLLRGSDSVYDTLSNAAEMKLPKSMIFSQREEKINDVLEELGLSRERETLVSKLSGGQRKRLSIAVEFIANPSLFFLDEPDSGLDDIMGRGLMENLRAIADKGKIIMVITHSPERASNLFNKVIVLAKSSIDNCGHLAFYGSTEDALAFFDVSSFKGIVKKINRVDENGEGLSDYYIEKFSKMDRR